LHINYRRVVRQLQVTPLTTFPGQETSVSSRNALSAYQTEAIENRLMRKPKKLVELQEKEAQKGRGTWRGRGNTFSR